MPRLIERPSITDMPQRHIDKTLERAAIFERAGHVSMAVSIVMSALDLAPANKRLLFRAANLELQSGRFKEAEKLFLELLRKFGENAEVLFGLTIAAWNMGEIPRARQFCERVLALNPENEKAQTVFQDLISGLTPEQLKQKKKLNVLMKQAHKLNNECEWKKAAALAEKVCEEDPRNETALILLIKAHIFMGDAAGARANLEKLPEEKKRGASIDILLAKIAILEEDIEAAQNHLQHAEADDTKSRDLAGKISFWTSKLKEGSATPHLRYLAPAQKLAKAGKWNDAVCLIQKGVEAFPQCGELQMRYGACLLKEGRREAAKRAFTAALEKKTGKEWHLHLRLAHLAIGDGDVAQAEYHYSQLKNLSADDASPRVALKTQDMGERLRAAAIRKGVIDPAKQLWHAGKMAEAYAKLEEGLAAHPRNPYIIFWQGIFALRQKDFEKAKACAKEMLSLNPHDLFAVNMLAEIARREGNEEEAERLFQTVIGMNPANPYALAGLSALALGQQEIQKAAEILDAAVRRSPDSMNVLLSSAIFSFTVGLHHAAEKKFEQVLARWPGCGVARKYSEKIQLARHEKEEEEHRGIADNEED